MVNLCFNSGLSCPSFITSVFDGFVSLVILSWAIDEDPSIRTLLLVKLKSGIIVVEPVIYFRRQRSAIRGCILLRVWKREKSYTVVDKALFMLRNSLWEVDCNCEPRGNLKYD